MSRDLIFDPPWWPILAVAAAAVVIFVSGNKRQLRGMMWVGISLFLLAVVWALISHFVDTDLEKAVKNTKAIVRAVDQKDWEKFRSLLSPQTSFSYYKSRDELVENGRRTAERIGLKSVRLTGTEAKQTDTLIMVDITVISEQDITLNRPLPTNWRFNYQDFGKGWVLDHIDALPNQQITPDMIHRELVRP